MNYSFDLHIHSCLTPYGGDAMTPKNIAEMCSRAGYDIVALTDYNTCGNSAAFQKAAEAEGLLAVPGMELCLREDAHVICLFPDLDRALAFSKVVRSKLPELENSPQVFGSQILMDEDNQVLGEETAFLVGSADIGAYEVVALVEQNGEVTLEFLCSRLRKNPVDMNGIVMILEIKGVLATNFGKIFVANF